MNNMIQTLLQLESLILGAGQSRPEAGIMQIS